MWVIHQLHWAENHPFTKSQNQFQSWNEQEKTKKIELETYTTRKKNLSATQVSQCDWDWLKILSKVFTNPFMGSLEMTEIWSIEDKQDWQAEQLTERKKGNSMNVLTSTWSWKWKCVAHMRGAAAYHSSAIPFPLISLTLIRIKH